MNIHPNLHIWPAQASEAKLIQRQLPHVQLSRLPQGYRIRYLLGLDCAFPRKPTSLGVAAAVLWDRWKKTCVFAERLESEVRFPYVPGLLGFREIPLLLPLLEQISDPVDAILVDGQGIAHPRRLGSAAHLALWLDENIPVVGVGKTRLVGEFHDPGDKAGSAADLSMDGEVVGKVLRSRDGCRPLFISPGGHVDVEGALMIARAGLAGYRIPEPIRLADRLAAL